MHMPRLILVGLAFVAAASCARPAPVAVQDLPSRSAPFDYVGQSWMRFDAKVAGASTRMILDTGGGITVLSPALCARVGCVPDGTHTGKRMSGQDIRVPMVRVSSLEIAGQHVTNARVGVLEAVGLLHPELGVEGFAALDLFRDQAFTFDYAGRRLVLEDEASSAARRAAGLAVQVRVENEGPSTVVYLPLALAPSSAPLEMEVDSGSRDMILDERFMAALGIDAGGPGVKRVEGRDETEHGYVRFFARLPRSAAVPGAPGIAVPEGATVMFQRIIHDGLLGHDFLSAHTTTFDIPRATMVFAR